MTTAQDGGKVVSLTHRPPLPPGNTPGTQGRVLNYLQENGKSVAVKIRFIFITLTHRALSVQFPLISQ